MTRDEQFETSAEFRGLLRPGNRQAYALAGKATITVLNPATGNRYTFKIRRKDDDQTGKSIYFVSLLSGPNNQADYRYLGVIDSNTKKFRLTAKSKARKDAPSVKAFGWLTEHWEDPRIEVWHEGACGRCGRKLTVPESIESGLGPICEGLAA